jgi:hypothetical protein
MPAKGATVNIKVECLLKPKRFRAREPYHKICDRRSTSEEVPYTSPCPHTKCLLEMNRIMFRRLSGVVGSELATGPKGRGFKPGQGNGF